MYLAPRIKNDILRAAIFAVFLFAMGSFARAVDKPRAASIAETSRATPNRVEPDRSTIGKIEIPALGLATRVLEGSDAPTLRLAVGHIPGTAVPGASGNVGLAAHRTTYFRSLRRIRVGDEIRFSTVAGTFQYRVVSLRVVLPSAVQVLKATPHPTLTLVTCYPFDFIGDAPQRLIVHAEMVSASPN